MRKKLFYITLVMALMVPLASNAREFRQFNKISTPEGIPDGATAVKVIQPVPRKIIEDGVKEIISKWNTAQLSEKLTEDFQDGQRLEDNILTYAQRDAKIRIISMRGHQTIQQYEEGNKNISMVSVTVGTQIEFESPTLGYQTRNGTSEFILKITADRGE